MTDKVRNHCSMVRIDVYCSEVDSSTIEGYPFYVLL